MVQQYNIGKTPLTVHNDIGMDRELLNWLTYLVKEFEIFPAGQFSRITEMIVMRSEAKELSGWASIVFNHEYDNRLSIIKLDTVGAIQHFRHPKWIIYRCGISICSNTTMSVDFFFTHRQNILNKKQ